MTFTEILRDLSGLSVAILGILQQLTALYRAKRRGGGRPAPQEELEGERAEPRLPYLALGVMCAVPISVAMAYSSRGLGVEGSWIGVFVLASTMALVITGVIWFAWRLHRIWETVGVLAIVAMLSTALSPTGPLILLFKGSEIGESRSLFGISLSLYTIALLGILHTLRKKRQRVGAVVAVSCFVVFVLALSEHAEWMRAEEQPKLMDDEANHLAREVFSSDWETRAAFYRYASEIRLAEEYRTNHSITNKLLHDRAVQRATIRRMDPGPSAWEQTESPPRHQADPVTVYLVSLASAGHMDSGGVGALEERLAWIHPIGKQVNKKAPIEIPGRYATDRFRTLSDYRMVEALGQLDDQIRSASLKLFNYPESVRDVFEERESSQSLFEVLFGKEQEKSFTPESELFVSFSPSIARGHLVEQLSLPVLEESYVAFNHYRWIAAEESSNENLFAKLDALPVGSGEVFLEHCGDLSFLGCLAAIGPELGEIDWRDVDVRRASDLLAHLLVSGTGGDDESGRGVPDAHRGVGGVDAGPSRGAAAGGDRDGASLDGTELDADGEGAGDDEPGSESSSKEESDFDRVVRVSGEAARNIARWIEVGLEGVTEEEARGFRNSILLGLREKSSRLSPIYLFDRRFAEFYAQASALQRQDDLESFLEACKDPVKAAIGVLVLDNEDFDLEDRHALLSNLEAFKKLSEPDAESLLYVLCSNFYRYRGFDLDQLQAIALGWGRAYNRFLPVVITVSYTHLTLPTIYSV